MWNVSFGLEVVLSSVSFLFLLRKEKIKLCRKVKKTSKIKMEDKAEWINVCGVTCTSDRNGIYCSLGVFNVSLMHLAVHTKRRTVTWLRLWAIKACSIPMTFSPFQAAENCFLIFCFFHTSLTFPLLNFCLSSYSQIVDMLNIFFCLILLYKNTGILRKNYSLKDTQIFFQLTSVVFSILLLPYEGNTFCTLKATLPFKSSDNIRVTEKFNTLIDLKLSQFWWTCIAKNITLIHTD